MEAVLSKRIESCSFIKGSILSATFEVRTSLRSSIYSFLNSLSFKERLEIDSFYIDEELIHKLPKCSIQTTEYHLQKMKRNLTNEG